jgi:hypothetical protein
MFPCFRFGINTFFFSSVEKALISFLLVSLGKITSSIKPLAAALNGLANLS